MHNKVLYVPLQLHGVVSTTLCLYVGSNQIINTVSAYPFKMFPHYLEELPMRHNLPAQD